MDLSKPAELIIVDTKIDNYTLSCDSEIKEVCLYFMGYLLRVWRSYRDVKKAMEY